MSSLSEDNSDPEDLIEPTTDYDDIDMERDLAITHKRNEALRERDAVKEFLERIKKVTSPPNPEELSWLSSLRRVLRREPIPLFENNINKYSEDYQLHLSYSWLRSGKHAKDPHNDFYEMSRSVDGWKVEPNRIFMPLGRLFVNALNRDRFSKPCNSGRHRVTRWTGYEVFLGDDMSLWIVFDTRSLTRGAESWYPVRCGLTEDLNQDTASPNGFASDIARLLPSLRALENVNFENAKVSVMKKFWSGELQLDEVDKSEGIRRLTRKSLIPVEKGIKDAGEITMADEDIVERWIQLVLSVEFLDPKFKPIVGQIVEALFERDLELSDKLFRDGKTLTNLILEGSPDEVVIPILSSPNVKVDEITRELAMQRDSNKAVKLTQIFFGKTARKRRFMALNFLHRPSSAA